MSKKTFKTQASSSRAVFGDAAATTSFGHVAQSQLSHVYEPPDLNGISNPNVVVAYKNVQKKDSTTKSKALEELHAYVQAQKDDKRDIEEAFLEAWVCLLRTAGLLWQ